MPTGSIPEASEIWIRPYYGNTAVVLMVSALEGLHSIYLHFYIIPTLFAYFCRAIPSSFFYVLMFLIFLAYRPSYILRSHPAFCRLQLSSSQMPTAVFGDYIDFYQTQQPLMDIHVQFLLKKRNLPMKAAPNLG